MINLLILLNLNHYIFFGLAFCFLALLLVLNYPSLFTTKNKESPVSKEISKPLNFFSSNDAVITTAKTVNVDNYCLHLIDLGNGQILLLKDFFFEPQEKDQIKLNQILNSDSIQHQEPTQDELIHDNLNNSTEEEKKIISSTFNEAASEAASMRKIMNEASLEFDTYSLQKDLYDIEVVDDNIVSENFDLLDSDKENNQFSFEVSNDENI